MKIMIQESGKWHKLLPVGTASYIMPLRQCNSSGTLRSYFSNAPLIFSTHFFNAGTGLSSSPSYSSVI